MAKTRKDARRTGLWPLAYMGVEPVAPSLLITDNRAPTTGDYRNFNVGTWWIDRSMAPTEDVWILVNKDNNVARWLKFFTGVSQIESLTGNVGGPVNPDAANNIDVVGAGPYTVTGNPAAWTLTIDDDGTIADQYDADIGSATPAANVLEIIGGIGGHINTLGAANRISIFLDGDVAAQYDTDLGSAVPIASVIQILGGELINTTGGTNIVTANLDRGSDGEIIIAATGATSAYANIISSDASINVANGPNTIDLTTSTSVIPGGLASFRATLSARQVNATGDATVVHIPFDQTEFDLGGNYNTGTHLFTAPVKGIYCFMSLILCEDPAAGTRSNTDAWIRIAGTYPDSNAQNNNNQSLLVDNAIQYSFKCHALSLMDVGDTAKLEFQISPGAKTVTVVDGGGVIDDRTWFAGFLVTQVP